jgi:RNA polymerase sigma-70 factor (ECF subfamily)
MNNTDACRCLAALDCCRSRIRRLAPTIYDPEDIWQEVYVALADQPRAPDNGQLQDKWLCAVARNIAVRRHRQEAVRRCQTLEIDPVNGEDLEPIATLEKRESQMVIRQAVASLKPKQRYVIERRFFAGQPFSEIASDLGVPEQTVRTRYKRAVAQLRGDPHVAALA